MPAQPHEPLRVSGSPWQLVCKTAFYRTISIADETRRAAEKQLPECRAEAKMTIRRQIFAVRLVLPDSPCRRHRDAAMQTETRASDPARVLLPNRQTECCKLLY